MHLFLIWMCGLSLGLGVGYAIHNNRTMALVFILAGLVFGAIWHLGPR